jgi:basic amino acid/polyamine antiporter, APA family
MAEPLEKPTAKRTVFVRDATGLVRQIGFTDTLIISLGTINILGGFVLTVLSAPFFFPGANVLLVFMLGAIPALAFVGMYSILSAAIPRSGGDYVWTGRILGPRVATVMAILFLFAQIISFPALNAWGIIDYALAQGFLALGLTTANPGLVSLATTITQPLNGFVLSVLILVFIILVGIFSVDGYKKVNKFSFIAYVVMLVMFLGALLSVSPSAFAASVDSNLAAYNVTYSSVVSAVNSNPQFTTFSLYNTVLAFPLLGFLTYSGFNFSTYAAGETKEVSKSIPRALILAVFITMIFLFLESQLTYMTMGTNFVNGVSYLFNTGALGSLPVQPTLTFFLALATNPWVGFLINVGVAVGNFLVALQCVVMFGRIIFALSFDGVIPHRFANVNDRFHSPHYAVLTVGILSILTESLFWYGPGLLTGYLNSAIAVEVAYLIPGLAAFLLPFVKRDLYERLIKPLPGLLGKSIGGWPLVSICGLGVTLIWIFGIYTELFPVMTYGYLGSSLGFAAGATIVPIIAALILFEGARAYRKKKDGIDIVMSFKEIPPE